MRCFSSTPATGTSSPSATHAASVSSSPCRAASATTGGSRDGRSGFGPRGGASLVTSVSEPCDDL